MATRQGRCRMLFVGISALLLAFAAGCAPHSADTAAPPGTTMGQPLTPAQIQAAQQARANKGNVPAGTPSASNPSSNP